METLRGVGGFGVGPHDHAQEAQIIREIAAAVPVGTLAALTLAETSGGGTPWASSTDAEITPKPMPSALSANCAKKPTRAKLRNASTSVRHRLGTGGAPPERAIDTPVSRLRQSAIFAPRRHLPRGPARRDRLVCGS